MGRSVHLLNILKDIKLFWIILRWVISLLVMNQEFVLLFINIKLKYIENVPQSKKRIKNVWLCQKSIFTEKNYVSSYSSGLTINLQPFDYVFLFNFIYFFILFLVYIFLWLMYPINCVNLCFQWNSVLSMVWECWNQRWTFLRRTWFFSRILSRFLPSRFWKLASV